MIHFDGANVSECRKYGLLTFLKLFLGVQPGVHLEVSALSSQVSGLRSQVSGLRSQVSGLRSQVSGLGSQVSGVRYQV